MKLKEKLAQIQMQMKAPKNLYNSFGKYNYRNAESILEAFKPFEEKYKVTLIVGDEIVLIGSKNYVKAIAKLYDWETDECIESVAYAREPLEKKGMDEAQITGATSSYARKYALNGLFLLDDTKDSDTDEVARIGKKAEESKKTEDANAEKRKLAKKALIERMCKEHNLNHIKLAAANGYVYDTLTEEQLENMLKSLVNKYGE